MRRNASCRLHSRTVRDRGGGYLRDDESLGEWAHFGDGTVYVALQQQRDHRAKRDTRYLSDGINHVGFVVDDLDAVMERLGKAGYELHTDELSVHPHRRRAYYLDPNDIEWEFVEYLSQDPHERNDHTL